MKIILLSSLIAATVAQFALAQTEKPILKRIDNLKADINIHLADYKKIEIVKVSDEQSTGSVYRYMDNTGNVVLGTIDNGDRNSVQHVEYYFKNNELVYAEQVKSNGRALYFTERFYLQNGHLIAWLNTEDKPVDSNSKQFKDIDERLAMYAKELCISIMPSKQDNER